MLFGTLLGKKYPMRKYVNVIIITTGVALFMGGGSSAGDTLIKRCLYLFTLYMYFATAVGLCIWIYVCICMYNIVTYMCMNIYLVNIELSNIICHNH